MSKKHSQGSPKQRSAQDSITTLISEVSSHARQRQQTAVEQENTNVDTQNEPQIPIRLDAPQSTPVMRDAQVGTISHRRGTDHGMRDLRFRSSSSDEYERDDPLTTKVVKIYKKRHLANPAPVDSDDDLYQELINDKNAATLVELSSTNLETDIPQSDATPMVHATTEFSSNESRIMFESDPIEAYKSDFPGNTPHGHRLASGLAFIYMAIPPDGGYGWLVLLLSFLAQLIVDGIVFSIGILLPYISTEFNVTSAQVVLVGSIQIGCYFMGGAFSSALINSYGFRPVALLGVVVSAIAITSASFCPNLLTMILCYSIVASTGGPGLSMIWVSSQLIIGYYFERYRPIASGFSCSGAGAGVFIFCITNSVLVPMIGWRNILRVQVIFILLIFFIALAYLEVAPTPVGVLHHDHLSSTSSNEYYGNFYVHYFLSDELSSKRSHVVLENYEPPQRQGRIRRWATRCSPCFMRRPKPSDEHPFPQSDDEYSERNYVLRADPMQKEDLFYTGPADYDEPHNLEQFEGKELELMGSQEHLQRAAYALHNIHDYDSREHEMARPMDSESSSHGRVPSQNTHKKHNKLKKHNWLGRKARNAMSRLFDVHLLQSFEFRVLLTSAFLYPMGFNIPFVYSKQRTTIPKTYSQWIGPAIGATSFMARILCGFVAYKLRNWTNHICGGGMILGGLVVFISAFYGSDSIWFQFTYGLLYGIAPAVFATLRALIYVRYLGLSKLTNAFGITALAMGLGVFIGTTLGGLLVDKTEGYMAPFAFAGLCITTAGTLKLILPAWIKYRENRKMI